MAAIAQRRAAPARRGSGEPVELAGRGAPYVRRLEGPPGSRTVVLLHGLSGAADLTWTPSYRGLSRFFSVVSLDLRGHGRGIPHGGGAYRLEDCADDTAALVRTLGVGPVIAVGYSMGGAVAQLLWQRHPETVAGHLDDPTRAWVRGEFGRCGFDTAMAAAMAVAGFSSRPWITGVDVPAAIVLTRHDRVVPPGRQRELADLIPCSDVYEIEAGHGACINTVERFLPALVAACRGVAAGSPRGSVRAPTPAG